MYVFPFLADFSQVSGSLPVQSSQLSTLAMAGFDDVEEREDFEFISEDELAEASTSHK